jgi:coproporphyrinogen III oxidase
MLNNTKHLQTSFATIQEQWSQAFTTQTWHDETFQPKPDYHNRILTIDNGVIFEKAGIACSTIQSNKLPPTATERHPELAGKPFQVTGISIVLHPKNPFAPSVHANLRYFQSESTWWFGGGMDMTPYYPDPEDCKHWHQTLKASCDQLNDSCYASFKEQCDTYFYLPHRQEMRGIGGIFFDDLNTPDISILLPWITNLGQTLIKAYQPILKRTQSKAFSEHHRAFQQHRRTRYAEFNLLYDRGTRFGLQFGGRIDSILMSMPPSTGWHYQLDDTLKQDEQTLASYLQPKDWLTTAELD